MVPTFSNKPPKILKQSTKSCFRALQNLFNDILKYGNCAAKLKYADVNPPDDPT